MFYVFCVSKNFIENLVFEMGGALGSALFFIKIINFLYNSR